jgi:regulator of cell morphogenesis and NO signaling
LESNFIHNQILDRYQVLNSDKLFSHGFINESINAEFVSKLIEVFKAPSCFRIEMFDKYDLNIIKQYIAYTHNYYITKKLPEMEQSIHLLIKEFGVDCPVLVGIINLYSVYYKKLIAHILIEDEQLLPYISYLQNVIEEGFNYKIFLTKSFNYSIASFASQHNDSSELNLGFIKQIITKHLPNLINSFSVKILLLQLETFMNDLAVHELIEDYILIPKARILERKLEQKISELITFN